MIKMIVVWSAALACGAAMARGAESHQHHNHGAAVEPSQATDSWRAANDRVKDIGGWKAYAREIQADQKARPAATPAGDGKGLLSVQDALALALKAEPQLMQTLATLGSRGEADFLTLGIAQREALARHAAISADVRKLYFAAVAAKERLIYQQQVTETFAIAAELAVRMRKAGNLNALTQSDEELAYAESVKSRSSAETLAKTSREALIRKLNLSGDAAAFTLPDRLPQLPATPRAITSLEVRLISERPGAGSDWPALVRAASDAREAITEYERSYATAKHVRDAVIPVQRRISEEHLLHYNGMIIGIFDLLKDARHQVKATESYMDALLAFWNADSALDARITALKEIGALARRDAWTK